MKAIVSGSQMRQIDSDAIEEIGIPGAVLMENAGKAILNAMDKSEINSGDNILILCGKGNNGGDGYVLARHLHNRGKSVKVIVLSDKKDLKGDALLNYKILQKIGVLTRHLPKPKELYTDIQTSDVIIDAILGTGLKGAVHEDLEEIFLRVNQSKALIIAVDIPSGCLADKAKPDGSTIIADLTVTMGYKKISQCFSPTREICGKLEVADISFPGMLEDALPFWEVDLKTASSQLQFLQREPDSYKHREGKLLVIAGSIGMTGAAYLSCLSAMRSGCGMVILAIPESLNNIMETKLSECMTLPLPEKSKGVLDVDKSIDKLQEKINWCNSIMMGPGLGLSVEMKELTKRVCLETNKPLLLDADSINHIAGDYEKLSDRNSETVLTPHVGEYQNLFKTEVPTIGEEVFLQIQGFSKKCKSVIHLKGAPSITANSDGVMVNNSGNSILATAGSGDVLSGVVAAFMARGLRGYDAMCLGAYMHGLCGDLAKETISSEGCIAEDFVDLLPAVLEKVKDS